MLYFLTSPTYCFCITLRNKKPRSQRNGALCVQHSPTAAVLSTSFLLNHAPIVRIAERIDYKTWGVIQQCEYESLVKKIEEMKQLVEFRQCSNTTFEAKCDFRVSPFYQV